MTDPAKRGDDALLDGLWWDAVGPAESADDEAEGFLSLGGFSLAASRLIAGVRTKFGIDIPLAMLLRDNASLADVREFLATRGGTGLRADRLAHVRSAVPAGQAEAAGPDNDDLAPSQRRLWLLSQVHPEAAAYNVVAALRLSGCPDADALALALDDVIERHDALRASVAADQQGWPRLCWHRSARGYLVVRDLPGPLTDEEATGLARQLAAEPIPLDQAPLLRAELSRFGGSDALLVLSLHHVISDQRSVDVVVGDLASCYAARIAQRGAWSAEPAPRLRDHVRAERELAGSAAWQTDIGYWRALLADPPDNRPFPFQVGDDQPGSLRGEGHDLRLGRQLTARIDACARSSAVTPAMIFMTCVAAVVASWVGDGRIVIGVPASRRTRGHEQDLVGFLVETLPILVEPGEAADLRDLLRRVQDRYVEAASHSIPTFDAIVDALELPARPLASPLFRTWFNDLTQGGPPPEFAGLGSRWVPTSGAAALFDANFYLHRDDDGYRLQLVRAADRMPGEVADELLAQCGLVLGQMLDGAGARPDRLPLLTGIAKRAWAIATASAPAPAGLRWQQVRGSMRTPHGDLSALEIDDAAADLAARLAAAGAMPGQVVQVESSRSGGLPVALLAAWRAGLVPALLDGTLPPARLAEIRELVRPALVVAVAPGAAAEASIEPGNPRPRSLAGASHLLFTTGSGGGPAAVVVPPGALAAGLAWYEAEFEPSPGDRIALLAGLGHDPVLRDMLVPLRSGGTLVVPPAGLLADPGALLDLLADTGITILHATPALLELLLAGHSERARALGRLRLVLSSGAPLRAALVRRLRAVTQAAIVNGYGTTETPQIAACHRVLGPGVPVAALAGLQPDAILPLGRGVAGTGILVVGPDGHPAGVGQLGEIVVRGTGLASGYLDDHDPLARFGTDSLASPAPGTDPGQPRLFRTGDLGRLGPDGLVYFAGRRDRQVTVNGSRVELAEVEFAARRLPGVAQAAAGLVETAAGPILTLHAVPEQGSELAAGWLRDALASRLPRYAVPSAIGVVDRLETNANHKVVLRAAAAVAQAPTQRARQSAAPASVPAGAAPDELTRWLASLLAQALGREVGPTENFFQAGLTSISLLHLHAQVASRLADPLPATALFTHPNLAAFASYLAGREPAARGLRRRRDPADLQRVGLEAQRRREQRLRRVDRGRPSAAGTDLATEVDG